MFKGLCALFPIIMSLVLAGDIIWLIWNHSAYDWKVFLTIVVIWIVSLIVGGVVIEWEKDKNNLTE